MIRRPSGILLKKRKKKNNSPDFFLRATEHTQKIKFELYDHINNQIDNSQNEQNGNIS